MAGSSPATQWIWGSLHKWLSAMKSLERASHRQGGRWLSAEQWGCAQNFSWCNCRGCKGPRDHYALHQHYANSQKCALPDQEAETVADAIVGGMFARFETAMWKHWGMQKTRVTSLHLQSEHWTSVIGTCTSLLSSEPPLYRTSPPAHIPCSCRVENRRQWKWL